MTLRLVTMAAVLTALLVTPVRALADAGDLDTSFANQGRIGLATLSSGSDLALQADGKTVATHYYGFKVARFGTDGFLDATFGSGGLSASALPNGQSTAVAIQPDGYIVVAGFIDTVGE